TNLYNKNLSTRDTIITSDGNVENSASGNAISDFIEVLPNEDYYIKLAWNVAYYDADKEFIRRGGIPESRVVNTSYNTSYIRLIMQNNDIGEEQVNKGDKLLPYEDYYVWFDDSLSPPSD